MSGIGKFRAAISILLMIGAAAAAGSAPGSDAPSMTIDACSLLSVAEISHAVRSSIKPGVRQDDRYESSGAYSSTCVWVIKSIQESPPDPAAPLGGRSFVILNAVKWPAGSGLARSFLQAFREAAANNIIPLPQARTFGDEALYWGDGLAVRQGDVSFGVSVFLPERAATNVGGEMEAKLAPHILGRLK